MSDDDKPVTRKALAGCALGTGALVLIAIVVTAIGGFMLYIMACANMPTGCH